MGKQEVAYSRMKPSMREHVTVCDAGEQHQEEDCLPK